MTLCLKAAPTPARAWEAHFPSLVKASTGCGWTVFPRRGAMRLQVRDEQGKAESITLPYPWEEAAVADALLRIRVTYKAYATGHRRSPRPPGMPMPPAAGRSPIGQLPWSPFTSSRRHMRNGSARGPGG